MLRNQCQTLVSALAPKRKNTQVFTLPSGVWCTSMARLATKQIISCNFQLSECQTCWLQTCYSSGLLTQLLHQLGPHTHTHTHTHHTPHTRTHAHTHTHLTCTLFPGVQVPLSAWTLLFLDSRTCPGSEATRALSSKAEVRGDCTLGREERGR